jgi:hypothetical protein
MGASPCGCALEAEADDAPPDEKLAAKKQASRLRAPWGCPGRFSDAFPDNADHLGAAQRQTLLAVDKLTGFGKHCTTCPRRYAAEQAVQRARLAYTFAERGCPEYVEPDPSWAMVEAIEAIGEGYGRRMTHEHEERMAKAKAEADKAKAERGGRIHRR